MEALLLGRKTYIIFASYWPNRGDDDPIAAAFNALPKFVVSRSLTDPAWEGITALSDVAEVRALKARFDELHVLVGQEALADGRGVAAAFRFAQPPQAFPKGATWLVYERAGEPVTGFDISPA